MTTIGGAIATVGARPVGPAARGPAQGLPPHGAHAEQTAPGIAPGLQTAHPLPRVVHGMGDLGTAVPALVARAMALRGGAPPERLAGKSAVLLFEKPSTRTRVSFELGLQRLGMHVSCIDAAGSQLARGESVEDTGLVLGRYADLLVVRAATDARFDGLAKAAGVPVLNALTDAEHPCQVLADWTALALAWGGLEGRSLAYVGDGNNMCHSYLLGAPLVGMDIRVATPPGHAPDAEVVAEARARAAAAGTAIHVGTDPQVAVLDADAVATDTWTSMGHDDERDARLAAFAGYTVDAALMAHAAPDAWFLHCLPGHWGEEATHDVAHGPASLIGLQAECRLWAQMALVEAMLPVICAPNAGAADPNGSHAPGRVAAKGGPIKDGGAPGTQA